MGYADELFDLTGKVVLVTGGSRGLGREMAFATARCGADVIIASRNYDTCVATADEIARETGRAAMPYGVHIGRWDQLDGLVDACWGGGHCPVCSPIELISAFERTSGCRDRHRADLPASSARPLST